MTAARGDLRSRADQLGTLTRGSDEERHRARVAVADYVCRTTPGTTRADQTHRELAVIRLLAALGLDNKEAP